MTLAQIRDLAQLAEQTKTRDLAKLAALLHQRESILQSLDALMQSRRQTERAAIANMHSAVNYDKWILAESARLTTNLQTLSQQEQTARAQAIQSSARVEALKLILERANQAELQQNRRRAERIGAPPDA